MRRIVALALFAGLFGLASAPADAQLLKRNRSAAPVVVVADPPAKSAAPAATVGDGVHPIVQLFVKQRVIAGLVDKGMPRAKARKIVDEHLDSDFLKASLDDHKLKLPSAPPPGGWIQWITQNLPAILDLISKLILLFGGL